MNKSDNLEMYLIDVGNALRTKIKGEILYSITDLNKYLVKRTGKGFDPTDTSMYNGLVNNFYLHNNGTAYNYFFSIPGGIKDTYDRDMGQGIYIIGNASDTSRGVKKGDITYQILPTGSSYYFRFTNNTNYRFNMQLYDTFKYSSGGAYYRHQNISYILYANSYQDIYWTDIVDQYGVNAFHFFSNNTANEPIDVHDIEYEIRMLGPGLDFTDYTTFNNKLKEITNGIGLKQSLYTDYLYPIFSDSNKVYCLCVLKFGSSETHLYYFYNNTDGETFKLTDVSYVVNSSSSADFINNSSIKLDTNFFYGVSSEISTKGSTGSTINAGTNYHLYSGTGVLVKQFNNKIY